MKYLYPLLFLWQLPQNIAGLAMLAVCRIMHLEVAQQDGVHILSRLCAGGVSLGEFVFVLDRCNSESLRKHELGHRVQSRMLGPLYLIVVGIPSCCLCIASNFSKKIARTYDDHFPENWANKLGKV